MPKILFASNNVVHFPNAEVGSLVGTYDANRVPYSILLTKNEVLTSPKFKPNILTSETWMHFRCFWMARPNGDAVGEHPNFFSAYDTNENLLFIIRKVSGNNTGLMRLTIYDGVNTPISVNCTIPLTMNKINSVDICFRSSGLQMTIELYVNSGLSGKAVQNSNTLNYGHPARFTMGAALTIDSTNPSTVRDQYNSEILVADADTRNARMNLLRPNAAGTYEDWLGSLSTLADDDSTTGMTTIATNQRTNMTLTPYNGAPNISNFVAVSTTTRGQNSPPKIQHSIRMGGVDYDSPEYPVGFPLEYVITDYGINPATSLPWVAADLIGLETGIASVA